MQKSHSSSSLVSSWVIQWRSWRDSASNACGRNWQLNGGVGGVAGRLDSSVLRSRTCESDYCRVAGAVRDSDLMSRMAALRCRDRQAELIGSSDEMSEMSRDQTDLSSKWYD